MQKKIQGEGYVSRQAFIKDANLGLLSRENNNLKLMLYLKIGASFVLTGTKILFLSLAKPQIPENAKLLLMISECEPGRLHSNSEGNKSTSRSFPKTLWAKKPL